MRTQVPTMRCGCGNCNIRKNASDTCPMGTSKEAITLYASDFSQQNEVDEVESEEGTPEE